jgi:RNA polymerase sigma-70 factor (ECF subfamily)
MTRIREDLVEDVLQETLLRALIQLADLEETERYRAWLIGIAANLVRMGIEKSRSDRLFWMSTRCRIRSRSRFRRIPSSPEEDLLATERDSAVNHAIGSLTDQAREVVELHYLEGLSYKEIATRLGVRIPTIEGRLYRARQQLKEDLKMTQGTTDMFELQEKLNELQDQVDNLQKQHKRIAKEDEMAMNQERSAAASQLRLPVSEDEPITWGIVGGFRTDSQNSKRTASRTTSIDNYLEQLTDAQIASFAKVYSSPLTVGILKRLVRGPAEVKDVASKLTASSEELDAALKNLESGKVIVREEKTIRATNPDVIVCLLTAIGLSQMFHMNVTGEIESKRAGSSNESSSGSFTRTRTRKA